MAEGLRVATFYELTDILAEAEVVNLELSRSSAALAAPAVALEYLLPEAPARVGVQPDRALFWTNAVLASGLRSQELAR